jgi:hexokinase
MTMENNIFYLSTEDFQEIALDLDSKIRLGLKREGGEIAALPTYISPGKDFDGKVLALDWGGTNFRAAVFEFAKGKKPVCLEQLKKPLSFAEVEGFKSEDLLKEMASLVAQLRTLDHSVTAIGYCFSYPAQSTVEGDAILLRWTKRIDIPDMVTDLTVTPPNWYLVGDRLLKYLNNYDGIKSKTQFKRIVVINDTVACLFAGLEQPGYDTYIGLIVGTGTNMAAIFKRNQIEKLSAEYEGGDSIPVNLESGNLVPTIASKHGVGSNDNYLTEVDRRLDKDEGAINPRCQLFEKAMAGGYIGPLFKHAHPDIALERKFDGEKLTNLMNYPYIYRQEYIDTARQIYVRSAKLVAASLAGLILTLVEYDRESGSYNHSINNICLAADGSLFWSVDRFGSDYNKIVSATLSELLGKFGLAHIHVFVSQLDDANLIGSGIAAMS